MVHRGERFRRKMSLQQGKTPCSFRDNFLNLPKSEFKCFVALRFERFPQNSLLFPCQNAEFADFGQNSTILGGNLKSPL